MSLALLWEVLVAIVSVWSYNKICNTSFELKKLGVPWLSRESGTCDDEGEKILEDCLQFQKKNPTIQWLSWLNFLRFCWMEIKLKKNQSKKLTNV